MYVYGIFFVPTFFSLLVGVNLLVWARARINYVFIFGAYLLDHMCITSERATELDVRTKMDHRVYFEVCLLLMG